MPLFTFHVDVPASPAAVAARLRAAVAPMPNLPRRVGATWRGHADSDRPFVGSVAGDAFRIRPNITYRNPFLPFIKGRILATAAGSRVNVMMFMHPLSLVVTLLWCGLLVAAELSVFDPATGWSFVPVGIMLAGALVSIAIFYRDALKAMPQLTSAVFNTAIAEPEAPPILPAAPPGDSSRTVAIAVAAIAGFILLYVSAIALEHERRIWSSSALARVAQVAAESSDVQAALGAPITTGWFPTGVVEDYRAYGYAALSVRLTGPKGKGTLDAVANRVGQNWIVQRAIVRTGGREGRTIDATPPPMREAVRYPAAGRVYLLPFDAESAADVRELPRYLKTRLDVDVTILPTESLPDDLAGLVGSKTKTRQLIAEKAIDRIEATHPEIAADLDAVIVGVTRRDMNLRSWDNDYAVNFRHGRFAIVSTARLPNPRRFGIWNAEEYPVRVRKLVTKNLAMLHWPVPLMLDPSSALANGVFTADEIDAMGENFAGELENARSTSSRNPCVTIFHRRDGAQAWRIDCTAEPPLDRRTETFESYLTRPILVQSHMDLPFEGHRPFTFVRKYRTRSDNAVGFGVGAGQSFDMAPLGDSKTFAQVDLVLEDGTRYPYHRTSPGTDYQTAKLETGEYQGSPFSLSTMEWNAGWDLKTRDGWIYRFPSSGPGRTWLQSALIGIKLESGREIAIKRGKAWEVRELHGPSGDVIRLDYNGQKQIAAAADASGRTLRYEYDAQGRLAHLVDPEFGDEFYEYDVANQLTVVRNAERKTMLVNEYGHVGEILSQTLADGRRLTYEYGWNDRDVSLLRVTLPDGYMIEWNETSYGFIQSWPRRP